MTGGRKMDEERQGDSGLAYRLADVFPCVISDLIGGCVEVLGHLEGNAGRTVSSFLTFAVIYPFYWRRIRKERKQAHSRGRRDERAGLSTDKDDKGREMWIFLGKSAGCGKSCWGQLRSVLCLT